MPKGRELRESTSPEEDLSSDSSEGYEDLKELDQEEISSDSESEDISSDEDPEADELESQVDELIAKGVKKYGSGEELLRRLEKLDVSRSEGIPGTFIA